VNLKFLKETLCLVAFLGVVCSEGYSSNRENINMLNPNNNINIPSNNMNNNINSNLLGNNDNDECEEAQGNEDDNVVSDNEFDNEATLNIKKKISVPGEQQLQQLSDNVEKMTSGAYSLDSINGLIKDAEANYEELDINQLYNKSVEMSEILQEANGIYDVAKASYCSLSRTMHNTNQERLKVINTELQSIRHNLSILLQREDALKVEKQTLINFNSEYQKVKKSYNGVNKDYQSVRHTCRKILDEMNKLLEKKQQDLNEKVGKLKIGEKSFDTMSVFGKGYVKKFNNKQQQNKNISSRRNVTAINETDVREEDEKIIISEKTTIGQSQQSKKSDNKKKKSKQVTSQSISPFGGSSDLITNKNDLNINKNEITNKEKEEDKDIINISNDEDKDKNIDENNNSDNNKNEDNADINTINDNNII